MSISSSDLALTGVYPPSSYVGFQDLKTQVLSKCERLVREGKDQYVRLKLVRESDFEKIEARREELGHVRFTYFPDIETLIVKIPSKAHEKAHVIMGMILWREIERMDIDFDEFEGLGATRYTGPTRSSKEGDGSWVNSLIRPDGYPFLVIEAGVSESLNQLCRDAAWWVANSRGQVQLVILIHVNVPERKIAIEKYMPFLATTPATRRTAARSTWKPKKVGATVQIDQAAVPPTIQGAPLVLPFQSVIGRASIPPLEHEISLSAAILLKWARRVFR